MDLNIDQVTDATPEECKARVDDLVGTEDAYENKVHQIKSLQSDTVFNAHKRILDQEIHDFTGLLAQAHAAYAELMQHREHPEVAIAHYEEALVDVRRRIALWKHRREWARMTLLVERIAELNIKIEGT